MYESDVKYGGYIQFSNHSARMLNFCEDMEYMWASFILVRNGCLVIVDIFVTQNENVSVSLKVKVKLTLKQATKAQGGTRGIALLSL